MNLERQSGQTDQVGELPVLGKGTPPTPWFCMFGSLSAPNRGVKRQRQCSHSPEHFERVCPGLARWRNKTSPGQTCLMLLRQGPWSNLAKKAGLKLDGAIDSVRKVLSTPKTPPKAVHGCKSPFSGL